MSWTWFVQRDMGKLPRMTVDQYDELKTAPRMTLEEVEAFFAEPPRHCSICDGVGHGYPGGGPCPLEMTMSQADVDREDEEYRRHMDQFCDQNAEAYYYNGYPNINRQGW